MSNQLPSRPHLDHLRTQAKQLLSELRAHDPEAARQFALHLPEATGLQPEEIFAAGYRLADAHSVVARRTGFAAWPALARHVAQLRALEGEWSFETLELEGSAVAAELLRGSRLLIDGDRFRMESPGANYEGIFTIDVEASPATITIDFVEGPEAGSRSLGIFKHQDDSLTICLTVAGSTRPASFQTKPGSGHALETLRRTSTRRPSGVDGGTPATSADIDHPATSVDRASFEIEIGETLQRLSGEWKPVELVRDGAPMPKTVLTAGSRTAVGNEVTVKFGGQVMLHVKMRIDETRTPFEVDYLHLDRQLGGLISFGIMEWCGANEVRFAMAAPGRPRPTGFVSESGSAVTLSRWKKQR